MGEIYPKTHKIFVNFVVRDKGGGVSSYAYEMVKGLIANGQDVYAVVSNRMDNLELWKSLPFKKLLIIDGFSEKFDYLLETLFFKNRQGKKIKNCFLSIVFDAIYIPFVLYWSNLINSCVNSNGVITTIHDPKPHSKKKILINNITSKSIKLSSSLVVLSDTFRMYLVKKYHYNERNIHHIPLGNQNYYDNDFQEIKIENISYDSKKINFLFYGQIAKYKGLDILLLAYKMLSSKYENISLTIVGSGDLKPYKDLYSNLKNLIIINRWIENGEIPSIFKGDNIVTICPYLTATQSGIIPIAMYYKSLVIATKTGGLSEQIDDNRTGLLIEPGDVIALYKKMEEVAINYGDYNKLLLNAKISQEKLSWFELSKKIIDII
jgi:glycosyltransferase involved in cell wall biosynthesis